MIDGHYNTDGYAELLEVIQPENAGWTFVKHEAAKSFPATEGGIQTMWVRVSKGQFTYKDEYILAEAFLAGDPAIHVIHLSDGVTDVVAP